MDIISMQMANKVLKRMNSEFNGMYDILVATEGQTVFSTSKPHDIINHGLHVYVNGYHAVEGNDYTHANEYDIEFKSGLRRGDIVLLSTQVVGVPKFEVTNPAYDDSTIVSEIAAINNRITGIINALDEDGDGSIIDTIADIKKQWQDADADVQQLIGNKAEQGDLDTLESRVDELANNMPSEFDPSDINKKIDDNTKGILESNKKIDAIEKRLENSVSLIDDVTGRKYSLRVSNGAIGIQPIGTNLAITHNAVESLLVGETIDFKLSVLANGDAGQHAKLIVSNDDNLVLQMQDGDNWVMAREIEFESLANTIISLRCGATEAKEHTVTFRVVRAENDYILGETSMQITSLEPPVVEPPVDSNPEVQPEPDESIPDESTPEESDPEEPAVSKTTTKTRTRKVVK